MSPKDANTLQNTRPFQGPNLLTIHSKLPDVGTTIFTVMSSLASRAGRREPGTGLSRLPDERGAGCAGGSGDLR